jgi:hypothetical protein
MAKESREKLKSYFQTGDQPTELEFSNWFDSSLILSGSNSITGSLIISGSTTDNEDGTAVMLYVMGNITASGNISSSGTIYANNFQSTGGNNNGINFIDDVILTGNFTSSANISASGYLVAQNITASGNISASGTIIANTFRVDDGTHLFGGKRLITSGGSGGGGTYEFRDGSINVPAGHITSSGNISASGNIYSDELWLNDKLRIYNIAAVQRISGSGGIFFASNKFEFNDVNISLESPPEFMRINGDTNILGNVTSSGTISSSLNDANHVLGGTLSLMGTANGAIRLYAGGTLQTSLNAKGNVNSYINAGVPTNLGIGTITPTAKLHVSGNILATTNITASGNISASGDLVVQNITASGNISASGTIYANNFQSTGGDINGINFIDDVILTGNFTSSGNISASGDLVVQNITATGNISASGDIYSNKYYSNGYNLLRYKATTDKVLIGNSAKEADILGLSLTLGDTSGFHVTASGNISASGRIIATSFTGSLQGNASTATTASFAQTASYVENAQTASYVENAQTASFVTTAQTASFVTLAQTASYVENAQTASFVTTAQTASFVTLAQTASYVENAQTASFVNTLNQSVTITGAITASLNISASGTGSFGMVGIGTTTPAQKLDVKDGFIQVSGSSASGYGYLLNRAGQDTYSIRHLDGGLTINNETDNRKEMTFDGDGNVGIGATSPTAKLHVSGNIWASGSSGHITASANISASGTVMGLTGSFSYGVILKSPNGSNFRFTVDDSGHLSITGSAL